MIFIDPNGIEYTTPPPPVVYFLTGHFSLCLDSTWTFPVFREWVIQYAEDRGSGFGNWIHHTTVASSSKRHYNFIEAHPEYNYNFRYMIRAKGAESPWSLPTFVGKPKVVGVVTGGTFANVVENPLYFLGEAP